jgi:two-component system response regulator RstA
MDQTTVLLIGEATPSHAALNRLLEQENILLRQAVRWDDVCVPAETAPPHMIVLDRPGSGVDGLSVCQEIRLRYAGLLVVVSDTSDERFPVLALDLGADAAFPGTAGAQWIAAAIKALLRRFAPVDPSPVMDFGRLTVDANRRDVFVAGKAAHLSTLEFQLLWSLASKAGCVVSRDEIHRELYNGAYNGYDRSIDVHVSRIRQKIGDQPASSSYLKTVRGIGYQFVGVEK